MTQVYDSFPDADENDISDRRLDAPAYHRNITPIMQILRPHFEALEGSVLETGSGTGQHITHMAREFPKLGFQPGDISDEYRDSVHAWIKAHELDNVRDPIATDLLAENWWAMAGDAADISAMLCFNVIHIAPEGVIEGLFSGANALLQTDQRLFLYGPFMQDGKHTSASNEQFDRSLKNRNLEWGVRAIEEVELIANRHGLALETMHAMPSNNFMPIFVRL